MPSCSSHERKGALASRLGRTSTWEHTYGPNRPTASRKAAHTSWAQTPDRAARTAPARQAFRDKFLDQVDPDKRMSPGDRAKAAENARIAF